MTKFYNELLGLCDQIERDWLKYNYATEDFYKVVWEISEGFDLSPLAETANQLRLLDVAAVRHNQHRSTFSDFHFQIYHNGRFLVEILNWDGSHVNVHDHDFSGVQFQLKGESLNAIYDFESHTRKGALSFGGLKVRKAEILRQGGRSIVRHGDLDPHCVFHLSRPTVSLLIRTAPTARLGAQTNYFPTVASNYSVNTDVQRKKMTGLSLLARQNPREFGQMLAKFLDEQSLSENFFMLLKLGELPFDAKYVQTVRSYAGRGEEEGAVVKSVLYNRGIDFLKTRANAALMTEGERLAVSVLAASTSPANLNAVRDALDIEFDLSGNLKGFRSKLNEKDKHLLENYLRIFDLKDVANELS